MATPSRLGTHAAAVALYPNPAYNPDLDFDPISMIAGLPVVVTARKDFPANDFQEFIRYVKTNVGKVNVAHAGVGSITHATCLLLHSLIDVQPTFVPFNGAAPAMNALLGGQVDYICNVIPDTVHHVHSGTAKGYAITTAERSPALPNVPTTKEAGLPQFDASAWNALFAPKVRRSRCCRSSPMRSTRRSMTRACAGACWISAVIFPPNQRADHNSWQPWSRVKSRVGRRSSRQQASKTNKFGYT
jgi:hypothetical protein